jgi:hypothetical protein
MHSTVWFHFYIISTDIVISYAHFILELEKKSHLNPLHGSALHGRNKNFFIASVDFHSADIVEISSLRAMNYLSYFLNAIYFEAFPARSTEAKQMNLI